MEDLGLKCLKHWYVFDWEFDLDFILLCICYLLILFTIYQLKKKKNYINFDYTYRYGQLSGMVEPIAGLVGILAVSAIKPLLPYALAFAAGAMIYVVVNDIIPESNSR